MGGKKTKGSRGRSARGQAYGSTRGAPAKPVARARRLQDGRVRESLEEAKAEQARLTRRIEREQSQPAVGEAPGAEYAREQARQEAAEAVEARRAELEAEPEAQRAAIEAEEAERARRAQHPGPRFEPWEGDPRPPWTIGAARKMLRDGYTVVAVMKRTGVGYRWLDDLPLDAEGRLDDRSRG